MQTSINVDDVQLSLVT